MRYFTFILVLLLSACGSTQIAYEPKSMTLAEAELTVEQMIMTQHYAWKPSFFVVEEHFMGWDFGQVSNSSSWGSASALPVGQGAVAIGSSSAKTKTYNLNERLYFKAVGDVHLNSWKRKGKQWYTVLVLDRDGLPMKHVLRTRSLTDAQEMTDAMTTLVRHRKLELEKE